MKTTGISIVLSLLAVIAFSGTARAQYSFYALTPCRAVDTRNAVSTNGGPAVGSNQTRSFAIKGTCGVPTTAKAVSINVTVTGPTAGSFLSVWPAGQAYPGISTINFNPYDTLANGAIVAVAAGSPDLLVYNASGSVQVIIDVTGYFQ